MDYSVPAQRFLAIVPFWSEIALTAATDRFAAFNGGTNASMSSTTEANVQLALTDFDLILREIHASYGTGGTGNLVVALRDDAADVVGSAITLTAANTEVKATGLGTGIARGSLINMRYNAAGTATKLVRGYLVVELSP